MALAEKWDLLLSSNPTGLDFALDSSVTKTTRHEDAAENKNALLDRRHTILSYKAAERRAKRQRLTETT